jgi:HAD superfamily phosphoserine phosphatase-like hydrolase
MIKAIVFDIDNTLTDDVSWLTITKLLGASVKKHEHIFDTFLKNEITYEESRRQLIGLWQQTGNANKAFWTNLFEHWKLKDTATSLIDYVHSENYQTALITGSVDLFAEVIARRLHIPDWYANTELVWDSNNQLISYHYVRDQALEKLRHLENFLSKNHVETKDCIVVGDGDNDIEIFKATGHGIAINSTSQQLHDVAWKQVKHLSDIREILMQENKKTSEEVF